MVHYTVCDVSGQQETDFYAFISVALDATTDQISQAGEKAVKEAPPDVHVPKADGVSTADLIAIVVDVLEDDARRDQYDRVLERIRRRGSGKTSWKAAIAFSLLIDQVKHWFTRPVVAMLLALVGIQFALVGTLFALVRMLLAWGRKSLAWFQRLLAREERD